MTGHVGGVWAVACGRLDGVPVAVTGGADGMVRMWNVRTGEVVGTAAAAGVRAVAFTDEEQLVIGMDRDVAVFNRVVQEAESQPPYR